MIERVGLLDSGLEDLVGGIWSIYSAWEYAAQPSQPDYTTTLVDEFKSTFTRSTPTEIEFMGLFDRKFSGVVQRSYVPLYNQI